MSDAPTEQPAESTTVEAPAQETNDTGSSDSHEVTRLREELTKARKWEQRAKENKAAADRLAELEEANKTETQKLSERLTAAETAADEARREALRYKIATEFRLSDEDADTLADVSTEEGMRKIAQRLAGQVEEAGKPRAPRPDRHQGRSSSGTTSTADQFAAAIESAL